VKAKRPSWCATVSTGAPLVELMGLQTGKKISRGT